ncbi:hypothetical protein LVJ82_16720 [Vitreoscilla massiliensis]|uniref:Transcriptional regulator n=1 Tax=Vitreoscilla massiliensis TaxID=1689272 RepID=A0ABY4DZU9_9NEIS|nr:hypothetical protein [Vitreoscilla massiliensis]UOO89066.1 hypothetical protein LVJ82_16720 [Vitreoscilla massiliensis]
MKTLTEISEFLSDRRKALDLEQGDMYMRIGMKQQQYQRAEAGNDIRLSSFLRILEGLELELVLQPLSQRTSREDPQSNLSDSDDNVSFWFNSGDD